MRTGRLHTPVRLLAYLAVFSSTACGGGGGSSPLPPSPPPPPPPVVGPATPLSITPANGVTVLAIGAGIPEAAYGLAVFAANHLAALSNTVGNEAQVICDAGGASLATNLDADGSATLTAGDVVNVSVPSGCFERLFADAASGNFDILLSEVYTGIYGDARFDGTVSLTSGFQIDSADANGAPVTITVVGDLDFSLAMRGTFIQALRLSLKAGDTLIITAGTNLADPVVERVTRLSFLRRAMPSSGIDANFLFRFDFSLESEALVGSISCQTSEELRGRSPSTPLSGRYVCTGASSSAVALLSDRPDSSTSLNIEVDAAGDGIFSPLATGDLFWSDFVEGQLFDEDVDGISSRPEIRTFGVAPVQVVFAAANDVIYNPVNDRLYVSNSSGIVELDPATLNVTRSANVLDVPTELALSGDGSTLWYGLRDLEEAGRLDVATMQPGNRISLGVSPFSGERFVNDIIVAPGSTDDIVVSMMRSEEVVAYNDGVELPNIINGGASQLVFRDADSIVGANDTNTGFAAFAISYDSQTGVVRDEVFPNMSPGFNAPLLLGSDDIWNSQGYSFNEIEQTRNGRVNGEVAIYASNYEYVVVSPADGLVYALDRFDPYLDVFDESTRARIGSYDYNETDLGISNVRVARITTNELIIAGDSRIARIAKVNLQPNINTDPCTVVSVGELLVDGVYDALECNIRDIAYDSTRDLIYAALPGAIGPQGNSIAVIDPATLAVQTYIPLTAEPVRIDISDDGTTLTVSLAETSKIAEIDLATRTLTRLTPLGFLLVNGARRSEPLVATAARSRPGFPDEVAVATNRWSTHLYASGTRLPISSGLVSGSPYRRVFFDENDSSRLIAQRGGEIVSFRLNGSGLDNIGVTSNVLPGNTITRQGNRLMNGRGEDLDIGTLTGVQVCDFGSPDFAFRGVTFSADANSAFFAEPTSGRYDLYKCDLATGQVGDPTLVPVFSAGYGGNAQMLVELNSGELVFLSGGRLLKLAAPF